MLYKTKDVLSTKEDIPERGTPMMRDKQAYEHNFKRASTKVYGRDDERWIEVIPVVAYEIFLQYDGDMAKGNRLIHFHIRASTQ